MSHGALFVCSKLRKELAHANLAIENFRRRHLKVADMVWQARIPLLDRRSSLIIPPSM